jgi:hypothetical protein
MSIDHFIRQEVLIKAGGRKFGPLHIGGNFYSVGVLSPLRYYELCSAIFRILGGLFEDRDVSYARDWLSHLPFIQVRPLAMLLVTERMRASDLARMTPGQFWALWDALLATTDLGYIQRQLSEDQDGGSESAPLGLEHMALSVVKACAGRYSPHEVLTEMPIAEFLAIIEAETDMRRAADPEWARTHVTDSDLAWFQKYHPELFEES